jgi:5-(carboxyamino)imidazole ribonucleotide synthase
MIVGILGGGQLGRMLALAGYPLGLRFRFFEPAEEAPVDGLAERIRAEYDDYEALARFADGLDVVTYEFENVPIEAVRFLAERVPHLYPPLAALEVSQDRALEKAFFEREGIAGPAFEAVDSIEELRAAVARLGLPAMLKTRRFGYDGKGQALLHNTEDTATAWQQLGGVPCVLEQFVPFDREFSVIGVRGPDGAIALYPATENIHREGILRRSLAPAPGVPQEFEDTARAAVTHTLEALDYTGVLAVEFFMAGDAALANEMAPRVHNSGHWTIEGAATSQFENHLRAVLGLPLGSTATNSYVAMLNLIGAVPNLDAAYALPDTHLHLYGKTPRAGRKLGHITVRTPSRDQLDARLATLAAAGIEVE